MRTNRATAAALDRALDDVVAGREAIREEPAGGLAAVAARARAALLVEVPGALADRHLAALGAGENAVVSLPAVRRRRARVLTVGLAATVMVFLLGSSAVAMSSSALPGEPLYGLKRAVERAQLAMPGGIATKAKLHLDFADRRLDELQQLLAARDAGEDVDVGAAMAEYDRSLARAEADVASAGLGTDDEALLAHVLAQIDKHVQRLEFLRDNQVPPQARDAIQRAIDNAHKAKDRVGHGRGGNGKPDGAPGKGRADAPGQNRD